MIITPRERDLGGFSVRRILPYATHKMVGPFIFFDHIGPANFPPQHGIEVRPHPHIHLATVTYLFEGKIRHRDSLGSDQLIEPGAINWMTAGRGIVHSERSPEDLYQSGSRLSGIQCWVALPVEHENIQPNFTHYPANILPTFTINGAQCRLLLGSLFEYRSPVTVYSDMFYLNMNLSAQTKIKIPVKQQEAAIYVVSGQVRVNNEHVAQCSMWVNSAGEDLEIEALADTHLMLLGGASIGKRYIYWNFVSSSEAEIEKAKQDWMNGPKADSRFPFVPGDDQEFIPLPDDAIQKNPQGNIL